MWPGTHSIVELRASAGDSGDDTGDTMPVDPSHDMGGDDDEDDDYLYVATKVPTVDSPRWEMGNDFDQFLNQCTVQSFLFLLKTCRDPHTVLYLEKFTQPMISQPRRSPDALPTGGSGNSKFLSYHGLAAMNTTADPTWESYFQRLLKQPVEEYIIESDLKYIPDYEMEINPPSLCTRLINVREQIALEMVHDLKVLSRMGDVFMSAYWEGVKCNNDNNSDPLRSGFSALLLFLDYLDNPSASEHDYAPSPLRKGNFDLVSLMATQESIHRILNNAKIDGQEVLSKSNRQYLSHFYLQRLVSHFTNQQPYGRSTQFLLELIQSSPIVSSTEDSIVDPTRIAELIVTTRNEVALEWRTRAMQVPDLHVGIKRLQLDLLMKSYDNSQKDAFQ